MAPSEIQIQELLKPLLLKDLRNQCRARGLTPAGGRESLVDRLQEHMIETGDLYVGVLWDGMETLLAGAAPAGACSWK